MKEHKWVYKDIEVRWDSKIDEHWCTADILLEKGFTSTELFRVYLTTIAGDILIGEFQLSPMPGCCAVVISHNSLVKEQYRGTIASQQFREVKTEIAKKAGYTVMIATSKVNDIPASKNMQKSGYRIVSEFTNKRTNNQLHLGVKVL